MTCWSGCVQLERLSLAETQSIGGTEAVIGRLRQLTPTPQELVEQVREIVREVFEQRDAAVLKFTRKYDTGGAEPRALPVPREELDEAIRQLPDEVVAGLQVAIANVAQVAQAGVGRDFSERMPQGQTVTVREIPVESAAVYVPGGLAPYPSTAVMGVVTARAAGVMNVVVCSPPGPDGQIDPVILGTCRLLGVERVYRMGGAHAIAALAFGTATVERVDVIVGPGNRYVQEAKREVAGVVGIDGFAGPSDLMVVFDESADPELVALDLLAQAEHGPASVVVAVSAARTALDALTDHLERLSPEHLSPEHPSAEHPSPERSAVHPAGAGARPGAQLAAGMLIEVADARAGVDLANAFAPEHLQLIGAEPEALASKVRSAGCLLVGAASATAFSDYVAGSNHILPTAGAARFASGLSVRHFRRRMSEVRIDPAGAGKLAMAGAPIARAEGFEWHARSMEARAAERAAVDSAPAASPQQPPLGENEVQR
jgi:histidinol dehydrogenase